VYDDYKNKKSRFDDDKKIKKNKASENTALLPTHCQKPTHKANAGSEYAGVQPFLAIH
jgi:hypothetical protein